MLLGDIGDYCSDGLGYERVLMVCLNSGAGHVVPGMMTEDKLMAHVQVRGSVEGNMYCNKSSCSLIFLCPQEAVDELYVKVRLVR